MKTSKKKTTTQNDKSTGRSKKTSGTRRLSKNAMKGMTGGFDFSAFGRNLASFFTKEIKKIGPTIIDDAMKHNWKK